MTHNTSDPFALLGFTLAQLLLIIFALSGPTITLTAHYTFMVKESTQINATVLHSHLLYAEWPHSLCFTGT